MFLKLTRKIIHAINHDQIQEALVGKDGADRLLAKGEITEEEHRTLYELAVLARFSLEN